MRIELFGEKLNIKRSIVENLAERFNYKNRISNEENSTWEYSIEIPCKICLENETGCKGCIFDKFDSIGSNGCGYLIYMIIGERKSFLMGKDSVWWGKENDLEVKKELRKIRKFILGYLLCTKHLR